MLGLPHSLPTNHAVSKVSLITFHAVALGAILSTKISRSFDSKLNRLVRSDLKRFGIRDPGRGYVLVGKRNTLNRLSTTKSIRQIGNRKRFENGDVSSVRLSLE